MSSHPTKKRVLRHILRNLYSVEAPVRWCAVRDLGLLAAERSAERNRELLRRLAWSLNEESGATGWGAPEAMGEILAGSPTLRPEFDGHFLGYLSGRETFLDNPVLDAGTLWALGRLGRGATFDVAEHEAAIGRFIDHPDSAVRGLSVWAWGQLGLSSSDERAREMASDDGSLWLIIDGEVVSRTVSELAGL